MRKKQNMAATREERSSGNWLVSAKGIWHTANCGTSREKPKHHLRRASSQSRPWKLRSRKSPSQGVRQEKVRKIPGKENRSSPRLER